MSYGWGIILAHVQIGKTEWTASLFGRDVRYIVPLRASGRRAENLDEGDEVTVQIEVQ